MATANGMVTSQESLAAAIVLDFLAERSAIVLTWRGNLTRRAPERCPAAGCSGPLEGARIAA
jgi:hypothetical protein